MKIIQAHNYYQQAGGEDAVVEAERELLSEYGNIVIPFYKSNEALGPGLWALFKTSLQTIWNRQTYREFRKLLQKEHPDVVHCHNTFPLISPSIYWACAKEDVPVVQTLHNYRLLCATPFLFRQSSQSLKVKMPRTAGPVQGVQVDKNESTISTALTCNGLNDGSTGAICELCVGKRLPFSALRYRCYRNSLAGTVVWAAMVVFHRLIGTWSRKVTAYIALTEFQKQKIIEGGLPADKVWVKPNFLQKTADRRQGTDKEHEETKREDGFSAEGRNDLNDIERLTRGQPYALFVGRLSPEKGCDVLIRAWSLFEQKRTLDLRPPSSDNQKLQLLIVGDGPELNSLEKLTIDLRLLTSVRLLGKQPKESVSHLMRSAQFLVFPSIWYETFGLTVVEAGLQGTPSMISDQSVAASFVKDGDSGVIFKTGSAGDLTEKIKWAFKHSETMERMGDQAKRDFEQNYSPEVNYKIMMSLYHEVLRR